MKGMNGYQRLSVLSREGDEGLNLWARVMLVKATLLGPERLAARIVGLPGAGRLYSR